MARIIVFQINECHERVYYYKSIVLLQKTNMTLSNTTQQHHRHSRAEKTLARKAPLQSTPCHKHLLSSIGVWGDKTRVSTVMVGTQQMKGKSNDMQALNQTKVFL
jgi:hypothetical protein